MAVPCIPILHHLPDSLRFRSRLRLITYSIEATCKELGSGKSTCDYFVVTEIGEQREEARLLLVEPGPRRRMLPACIGYWRELWRGVIVVSLSIGCTPRSELCPSNLIVEVDGVLSITSISARHMVE